MAKRVLGQLDTEEEMRLQAVSMVSLLIICFDSKLNTHMIGHIQYAVEGKACRNKMHSTVARDEACVDQCCSNSHSCDNCKLKKLDKCQGINGIVLDLIKKKSYMDVNAKIIS